MRNLILIICLLALPQMVHAECVSYNSGPCVPTMMPVQPVTWQSSNIGQTSMQQTNQLLNQYNSMNHPNQTYSNQGNQYPNSGYMNPGSQGQWIP